MWLKVLLATWLFAGAAAYADLQQVVATAPIYLYPGETRVKPGQTVDLVVSEFSDERCQRSDTLVALACFPLYWSVEEWEVDGKKIASREFRHSLTAPDIRGRQKEVIVKVHLTHERPNTATKLGEKKPRLTLLSVIHVQKDLPSWTAEIDVYASRREIRGHSIESSGGVGAHELTDFNYHLHLRSEQLISHTQNEDGSGWMALMMAAPVRNHATLQVESARAPYRAAGNCLTQEKQITTLEHKGEAPPAGALQFRWLSAQRLELLHVPFAPLNFQGEHRSVRSGCTEEVRSMPITGLTVYPEGFPHPSAGQGRDGFYTGSIKHVLEWRVGEHVIQAPAWIIWRLRHHP